MQHPDHPFDQPSELVPVLSLDDQQANAGLAGESPARWAAEEDFVVIERALAEPWPAAEKAADPLAAALEMSLGGKRELLARVNRTTAAGLPKPATVVLNDWKTKNPGRTVTYSVNARRKVWTCSLRVVTELGETATAFASAPAADLVAQAPEKPMVPLREKAAQTMLRALSGKMLQGEAPADTEPPGVACPASTEPEAPAGGLVPLPELPLIEEATRVWLEASPGDRQLFRAALGGAVSKQLPKPTTQLLNDWRGAHKGRCATYNNTSRATADHQVFGCTLFVATELGTFVTASGTTEVPLDQLQRTKSGAIVGSQWRRFKIDLREKVAQAAVGRLRELGCRWRGVVGINVFRSFNL